MQPRLLAAGAVISGHDKFLSDIFLKIIKIFTGPQEGDIPQLLLVPVSGSVSHDKATIVHLLLYGLPWPETRTIISDWVFLFFGC